MVWELDDIEQREATGSTDGIVKEVFGSDLRIARKWVQQSRSKKKQNMAGSHDLKLSF